MPTIYVKDKDNLPKRKEYDFYPTPLEFCKSALNILPLDFNPDRILDPGAGDGIWGKALGVRKGILTGVELRDIDKPCLEYDVWFKNSDYLEDEKFGFPFYLGFDLIIGNPPYSLAKEFILRSLKLLRKDGYLLFLLKLQILESKDRYDTFYSNGLNPKEVWVSARRISFTGDGKTNADAHCLCLWQEGWSGDTTLKWLDWTYEKRTQNGSSYGKG